MKIELKNTDFKNLYEWLIDHTDISTPKVGEMIHKVLKPQYDKAFLKQKIKIRKNDCVQFKMGKFWYDGIVSGIVEYPFNKRKYIIKYKITIRTNFGEPRAFCYTPEITEKNIRKI